MKWSTPSRGDVAIAAAVLLLVWALATPALRARAFRALSSRATADVEAVVRAAQSSHASMGRWPEPGDAGVVPPELTGRLALETGFVREDYTLEWSAFDVVDYVEVEVPPPAEAVPGDAPPAVPTIELRPEPRRVGALSLRSGDTRLLAELLRRFGPERSFVRDSTWTLIVEDPATGSPPPSPGS
mgnify:CR=1 FL=1